MTSMCDSLYDWIDPNHTMTLLERKVATLRKKVSMADTERRRLSSGRRCRNQGARGADGQCQRGKHFIPTRQTANSHHPQVQARIMSQNHPRYRHHRHYRNCKCVVQRVHKHVKCGCHNLGLLLLSLLSEPRHPTTRSSGDDSKHTGHHRTSRPSCYCLATSCTWQQWVSGSP